MFGTQWVIMTSVEGCRRELDVLGMWCSSVFIANPFYLERLGCASRADLWLVSMRSIQTRPLAEAPPIESRTTSAEEKTPVSVFCVNIFTSRVLHKSTSQRGSAFLHHFDKENCSNVVRVRHISINTHYRVYNMQLSKITVMSVNILSLNCLHQLRK